MGFSRQEYWSGLPFPPPGDHPHPRIKPLSPALTGRIFFTTANWEARGKLVQSLSHVQLCDPMDCNMPGFPVHHQLLELAQTHVHRVGDAIQPSHPLLSPSPPVLNLS